MFNIHNIHISKSAINKIIVHTIVKLHDNAKNVVDNIKGKT